MSMRSDSLAAERAEADSAGCEPPSAETAPRERAAARGALALPGAAGRWRAGHLIWGADLHLSLDESILWASERTASTLATLPVMASGALKPPLAFVTTEPQPRGFAVSPDGHWLVAAGERSTTVSLYDLSDPVPRFAGQAATGAGANWVRIIPR